MYAKKRQCPCTTLGHFSPIHNKAYGPIHTQDDVVSFRIEFEARADLCSLRPASQPKLVAIVLLRCLLRSFVTILFFFHNALFSLRFSWSSCFMKPGAFFRLFRYFIACFYRSVAATSSFRSDRSSTLTPRFCYCVLLI